MGRTALIALAITAANSASAQDVLSLWYHGAENEVEKAVLERVIADFNVSQNNYVVQLESLPEASYNQSVEQAALSGNLPCIIDVDGPIMPRWAWAGFLQPLPLNDTALDGFLTGAKGYYNGTLYSVGLWEAAVAFMTRRSTLETHDIRVPTLDDPWTTEELNRALARLKDSGEFDYPLDLGMAWSGEWYSYAFSPFLQSFGGDLINRANLDDARSKLTGAEAQAFGSWWASLFENGFAEGPDQSGDDRNTGFINGRYAISYNGNWSALPAVEAFGDDILFLPNVDHGNGPIIGASSWQFGVSSLCPHPDGAADFIKFALQDTNIAAFSDNLGLIPATASAAPLTQYYRDGGEMEVFFGLSEAQSKIRPVTPAYLAISPAFEEALKQIAVGGAVTEALEAAVTAIEADINLYGDYREETRCNEVVLTEGRWALRRCGSANDSAE